MKPWRSFRLALVLVVATALSGAVNAPLSSARSGVQRTVQKAAGVQAGEVIIVDHTTTDITAGHLPKKLHQ